MAEFFERNIIIFDVETTGLRDIDLPIEVGMLVVTPELKILDSLQMLVFWGTEFVNRHLTDEKIMNWNGDAVDAYAVHRIPLQEITIGGFNQNLAKMMIRKFAQKYTHEMEGRLYLPLLLSDNAWFDTCHLRKIFQSEEWPFHYTTWDTSLLFAAKGIIDPKPAHRAMADVFLLYEQLKKAINSHLIWP